MHQATFNGTIVAASDKTVEVEGNIYFPLESVEQKCLEKSNTTTVCGWKGTANYYHVVVEGERCEDGAWTYLDPKPEAADIKGYVAFWKNVSVS
jgi:uncharacterized protein (DUF427 family)